jgi:hypothetical protein
MRWVEVARGDSAVQQEWVDNEGQGVQQEWGCNNCQRLITTMLDEVTPWSNSRAWRYQRLHLSTKVYEAVRVTKSTW